MHTFEADMTHACGYIVCTCTFHCPDSLIVLQYIVTMVTMKRNSLSVNWCRLTKVDLETLRNSKHPPTPTHTACMHAQNRCAGTTLC